VFVEDRLFATLDPLTREVALDDKHSVLITDNGRVHQKAAATIWWRRSAPHSTKCATRNVLVHVIDASHPTWEEQRSWWTMYCTRWNCRGAR